MTIKDVKTAFDLINQRYAKEQQLFFGEIKEEAIIAAEKLLKMKFPKSYHEFIHHTGFIGVKGLVIYGLRTNELEELEKTGIVWSTLSDREELGYPNHILCLSELGDGSYYALDTSQMNSEGECPVVIWPVGGYETTPKLEIVAEDFGKFFLDMVQKQIEYENQG